MENVIELEIGEGREAGQYVVRVVRSVTGGEPTGTFTLDISDLLARRPHIEATVLASSVPARRVTPVQERPVRELGELLFGSVFTGPVGGVYRASLGATHERRDGLQVVLRLTAPGLGALPWETLYDPEIGAYLCRKEPLIRHVPSPYTAEVLEVVPPLRILGMVASPRGLPVLDVDAERQHLQDALSPHLDEGRVELVWLEDVSYAGLHAALLQDSWHVLHFVGHGAYDTSTDEGVLAFVGAGGRVDYVEASRLADVLDEAEPTPRLVVLNSCSSGTSGAEDLFSGTAATLVHSGIHAVAAMQFAITDSAAIAFARAFYTAIAHGRGIDTAMRSGRIGILGAARGTLEWVTPVLYRRGGTAQLFALTPRAGQRADEGRTTGDATGEPAHPLSTDRQVLRPGPPHVPHGAPQRDGSHSVIPSGGPQGQREAPGPKVDVVADKRRRSWLGKAVVVGVLVVGLVGVGFAFLRSREPGPGPTGGNTAPATTILLTVQRAIPATQVWSDMGLRCAAGETLQIGVSGTVMHEDSPTGKVGPDGLTDPYFRQFNVPGLPDANTVAAIGSLDQALPFFVVGSGTTYTCPRDGALFLGVNDAGVANNSGAFNATITKSRIG